MSDDTPTQRFDAAGDDGTGGPAGGLGDPAGEAKTERLSTPDAPAEAVVEERKSRRLMIILASVGGALLLAVLIVLILLLTRPGGTTPVPTGSPSPTPSATVTPTSTATATATATATPTPTPTQTTAPPPPPPPPSKDAEVDSFNISPGKVDCSGDAPVLHISWDTSNADYVYFGVDTNDASQGPYFGDSLPASGNSDDDFPNGNSPFTFSCGNGQHKYAITAVNSNGTKDTVTITVKEQ